MLVLRNATEEDLDGIFALAAAAGPGMTTLKADRAVLQARLAVCAASFAGEIARSHADYVFVLEDLENGRIGGVSAIKGAAGGASPFYNYRIGPAGHASTGGQPAGHFEALHLTHALSEASELCSLFLHPHYRTGVNGKLLSKARMMFLAQFPEHFSDNIVAEMRGFQDANGMSPFWESVGRPFFQMEFQEADDLCGTGERLFIEQLLPRLPLYTGLLSADARAAIGQTHPQTAPARALLEQEGLRFNNCIDIFDGGPVLEALIRQLRAARDSRLQVVSAGSGAGPTACLVATTQRHRFRVIAAQADPHGECAGLAPQALQALQCERGAHVRVLALHGPDRTGRHNGATLVARCGDAGRGVIAR